MTNYFIGYKQANDQYAYVSNINAYSISLSIDVNEAINFLNEELAKNITGYLNARDSEKTYLPLMVTTDIKEVE